MTRYLMQYLEVDIAHANCAGKGPDAVNENISNLADQQVGDNKPANHRKQEIDLRKKVVDNHTLAGVDIYLLSASLPGACGSLDSFPRGIGWSFFKYISIYVHTNGCRYVTLLFLCKHIEKTTPLTLVYKQR
jgi:hypothetical protein